METRYVFYTDNINKPFLDGYSNDISDKISLDLSSLNSGQEFKIEDTTYRIISTSRNENTSPESENGMNILCEVL